MSVQKKTSAPKGGKRNKIIQSNEVDAFFYE